MCVPSGAIRDLPGIYQVQEFKTSRGHFVSDLIIRVQVKEERLVELGVGWFPYEDIPVLPPGCELQTGERISLDVDIRLIKWLFGYEL